MPEIGNETIPGTRPKEPESRQLSPVARNGLTIVIALIVVLNVVLLINRLGPPSVPDTTAKLRTSGPRAVKVYRALEGEDHIHLVEAGSTLALGEVHRLPGPRYPVHVTVDGDTTVQGFVDAKDLEPGELERVKSILEKAK